MATLAPGECADVSCDVELAETPIVVYVVPDPGDTIADCVEGNDSAVLERVACPLII